MWNVPPDEVFCSTQRRRRCAFVAGSSCSANRRVQFPPSSIVYSTLSTDYDHAHCETSPHAYIPCLTFRKIYIGIGFDSSQHVSQGLAHPGLGSLLAGTVFLSR